MGEHVARAHARPTLPRSRVTELRSEKLAPRAGAVARAGRSEMEPVAEAGAVSASSSEEEEEDDIGGLGERQRPRTTSAAAAAVAAEVKAGGAVAARARWKAAGGAASATMAAPALNMIGVVAAAKRGSLKSSWMQVRALHAGLVCRPCCAPAPWIMPGSLRTHSARLEFNRNL